MNIMPVNVFNKSSITTYDLKVMACYNGVDLYENLEIDHKNVPGYINHPFNERNLSISNVAVKAALFRMTMPEGL